MKRDTYRAAIYKGIGNVEVVDLPYTPCGDDDIVVRNLLAGVCGSDLAAYKRGGEVARIPKDSEFGHEMISEVVEIGKNVKGLKLGDHVFPNMGNAKRDRTRMSTVGGFSEYIHIPQCELGFSVIPVDNDIPLQTAVLLEPFVVGTRGARNIDPGPGKTAIVFGAGIIGMGAAIMCKWYGCEKVMIVDISDFRLENAKHFGLITCNSAKEDLKAKAFEEFGRGRSFLGECCNANLYIDALGLDVSMENFSMLAGREASLAIVGKHAKPVTIDLIPVTYNNWQIKGCGSTPIEVLAVDILKMMKSGQYDLSSLVSHEYKLDQINDALVMGGKSTEAQKVCISYA